MIRDYKIYYNDSVLLIKSDHSQSNENFAKVLTEEAEVQNFINNPQELFDPQATGNILLIVPTPEKALETILSSADKIMAGGGIVFNETDDILLIFRRGKWDLPKGKIEKGEKVIDGARREVEEETGVKVKMVVESPIVTHHAYVLKGKKAIKETEWFIMKAQPGQTNLKPQAEEDIEQVLWVKKADLHNYKAGSYHLVWDLLSVYAH
ncbi:MAG: NUDIX domain-containing protein [Chitinophagales bacterium]